VLDRDLNAPPAAPAEGARYIVGPAPIGAWTGRAGLLAAWREGAWSYHPPKAGFLAFVVDESALLLFDGATWVPVTSAVLQNLTRLGIGTAADAANPFSAKLNAALWTARSVGEGGTGDLRYTMNKEGAGRVLSLLLQSGFSGRAEIGLVGDENLTVRTSADGATFTTALKARRLDAKVSFPQGVVHEATGKALTGLIFTPGGDGQVSIYRNDAARAQNPRTATIASVSGDLITLSTPDAPLFFHAFMGGVCYLRVWNVTKIPAQPAWVKAAPSGSTLQVLEAAALAGWGTGETVQVGDPTDVTPNRVVALDISPMLQNVLGGVFRQSGILCKANAHGVGGALALSPAGVIGSFVTVNATDSGQGVGGLIVVPCTQTSPVSNSNLVFLREGVAAGHQLGSTGLSAIGVFG
jgi:hypothetical protein